MFTRFYRGLTLLFLSRQGYWTSEKTIASQSLWQYCYPLFLSTAGVLLLFLSSKNLVLSFLRDGHFFQLFSYEQLALWLIGFVLVAGVAYENYFTLKCLTRETLSLFFGIGKLEFRTLLLVKNSLLVLPVLVASLFFDRIWEVLFLFVANHVLSVVLLSLITSRQWKAPNFGLDVAYLLSVLDGVSLLKLLCKPLLSLSTFWLLYQFYPEYFGFSLSRPSIAALFIGFLAYQAKGLSYYVFALTRDLPYLKVAGLPLALWLRRLLALTLALSFLPSLLPVLVMGVYQAWSLWEIFCVFWVLLTTFLGLQGYQLKASLYFNDKAVSSVREVELYRLTVKERLCNMGKQVVLYLVYPLAYVFRNDLLIYSWGICLVFVVSFVFNTSRVISRLATSEV